MKRSVIILVIFCVGLHANLACKSRVSERPLPVTYPASVDLRASDGPLRTDKSNADCWLYSTDNAAYLINHVQHIPFIYHAGRVDLAMTWYRFWGWVSGYRRVTGGADEVRRILADGRGLVIVTANGDGTFHARCLLAYYADYFWCVDSANGCYELLTAADVNGASELWTCW